MFLCKGCFENRMQDAGIKDACFMPCSVGHCEDCGQTQRCADPPSRILPVPTSRFAVPALYYIQNRGFCGNCIFWWREGSCGYTTNLSKAGKFTEEEAKKLCCGRDKQDVAWQVKEVDALVERHLTDAGLRSLKERGVYCHVHSK